MPIESNEDQKKQKVSGLVKRVVSPAAFQIGKVYEHPKHGPVYLESGYYLDPTYGRVSNFWNFKKIRADGTMSRKTFGEYGQIMQELKFKLIVELEKQG